ncbi:hypothetical protein A9R01_12340 ['Osedax' symbiont bacterium Rs2_46_30_T18]|nr:hypothetical protein A9R01_12340 ['Osedax' symbiont bacterium Rs2_46_30_T18]
MHKHTKSPSKPFSIRKLSGSLLIGCVFVTSALANPVTLKNDPKRPVGKISQDLNISTDQFVSCFSHVNPTPGGDRPESGERVHANKKVLLSCLQQHNSNITNDSLDRVMDKYRPGGRAAQVPRS